MPAEGRPKHRARVGQSSEDPVDDRRAQLGAQLVVHRPRRRFRQEVLDGGSEGDGAADERPHFLLALLVEVSPGAVDPGARPIRDGQPEARGGEEGTQGGVPRPTLLCDAPGRGPSTPEQELHGDADGFGEAGEDVVVFRVPPGFVPPDGVQGDAGAAGQLTLGEAGLAPRRGQTLAERRIRRASDGLAPLGRFILPFYYQMVIVLTSQESPTVEAQGNCCPQIMAVWGQVDKAREDGCRIVLVDDDPGVRELCVEALRGAGYRVDAFGRGEDALEALARAAATVLVVDWAMPGLDGAEVARRALALDPRLAVLMVTGSRREAAAAAARAGVRYILDKPFDVEDLVAAVADLATGEEELGGS